MPTSDPLDQIEYHLSQAMHLLHQYRDTTAPLPKELVGALSRKPQGSNKSLREWVAWLKKNKPAYRQVVWDATGLNLTAHKSMVLDWTSDMAYWSDEQMPEDTLCRMRGPAVGPGAPPSIYFLWSQRFDIYPEYGVGPKERPDTNTDTDTDTLLGVVHPPLDTFGLPANEWDEWEDSEPRSDSPVGTEETEPAPDPEPESAEPRLASLDDWHERWDPLFDVLAANDATATEDEKQAMLDTLPEGVSDPGAVLAISYRDAVKRYRSSQN